MIKHFKQLMVLTLMMISLSSQISLAGERGGNGVIGAPRSDLPMLECGKIKIIKSAVTKFKCSDARGYEFKVSINQIMSGMLVPLSGQKFKILCSFFKANDFSGTHKSVKLSSTFVPGKKSCFILSEGKGKVDVEAKSITITEI